MIFACPSMRDTGWIVIFFIAALPAVTGCSSTATSAPPAVARPSGAPIETPPPVTFGDAVAAAERMDVDAYRSEHEFPGCFVCGPDRQEGDGLRILSAPFDRPGMRVWPWIPEAGAFDDGVRIHSRSWDDRIARDLV